MAGLSEPQRKALENVGLFIDESILLPENVFKGSWGGFYFFDPDWVVDKDFVKEARALLEVDGSQSICLLDLKVKPGSTWYSFYAEPGEEWSTFFFSKEGASADYQAFLMGPNEMERADDPMRQLSRYGCASELGRWCIYTEGENEIGVMAIRDRADANKYLAAFERLGPAPIDQALADPPSWIYAHLIEEFRVGLLENYATPGE